MGWPMPTIGVWGQWEGLEGRGQRGWEPEGAWPEVGVAGSGWGLNLEGGSLGSVRLGWPTSTIGVWGEWVGLKGAWSMGGKPEGAWPEVGGS